MIKQILAAIGIFIVVVIGGLIFSQAMNGGKQEMTEVKIGEAVFKVEIVDTPAARAKGLSGRNSLKEDSGMLFVFSQPAIQKFWMKDMKFPIDIIWMRDDKVIGMVIGAEPAAQALGEPRPAGAGRETGPDYTIYTSPEPADRVLEINVGLAQKLGIKTGERVIFRH